MAVSRNSSMNSRVPARTSVLMTAVLFTREGVQNIRVKDLSPQGARIFVDSPLRDGCDAVFKRGGVFVAGQVAWSAPGKAGIRFYRELSASELESAFNAQSRGSPMPVNDTVGHASASVATSTLT
jgi:hypothetical protein